MFAPSFLAGRLITRFGLPAVLFTGLLSSAACAAVASTSTSLAAFYAALLLLGVGWNFMYVGGTALLASSHTTAERARVQGAAELARYAATAAASLSAGPILEASGWASLNIAIVPLLVVAPGLMIVWLRRGRDIHAFEAVT